MAHRDGQAHLPDRMRCRRQQHSVNPCHVKPMKIREIPGQIPPRRRPIPVFLSVQLTHVSCRVTESGLEAVNPQFRGLSRVFCSYSAEAGNRGQSGIHAARNSKRRPGLSRDSATRNR